MDDRPPRLTALPSPAARAVAFISVLVAGACGGLIGFAFSDLQCEGSCGGVNTLAALLGAVVAAGGTAVVAVLVLRAMGEWEADRRQLNDPFNDPFNDLDDPFDPEAGDPFRG